MYTLDNKESMHQITIFKEILFRTLLIYLLPKGVISTHALIPDFLQLIDYISHRATVLVLFSISYSLLKLSFYEYIQSQHSTIFKVIL